MYQDSTATLNFATVKEVMMYSRQLILNCLRVAKALFFQSHNDKQLETVSKQHTLTAEDLFPLWTEML